MEHVHNTSGWQLPRPHDAKYKKMPLRCSSTKYCWAGVTWAMWAAIWQCGQCGQLSGKSHNTKIKFMRTASHISTAYFSHQSQASKLMMKMSQTLCSMLLAVSSVGSG